MAWDAKPQKTRTILRKVGTPCFGHIIQETPDFDFSKQDEA